MSKDEAMTPPRVYTVSEVTKAVRYALEGALAKVWIEGEISDCTLHHASGHLYFSLKDRSSVLRCAMFKRANQRLQFSPAEGMSVLCFGSVSVYEVKGQYQLIVEHLEPKGVGALQLAFEQLKKKLSEEGLFDGQRKRPIPPFPERVGVVTSQSGAALRDILQVARRRAGQIDIVICPVRVEGKGAAEEICAAIDACNRFNEEHAQDEQIEVLIVGRGGGSAEDLWAFNEEVLARAIARSRIPLVSAVGHETDWTIADLVADVRAPTPSAAAELVFPQKERLWERLAVAARRLVQGLTHQADVLEERFSRARMSRAFRHPYDLINAYRQRLDDASLSCQRGVVHAYDRALGESRALSDRLHALSPLQILRRGYSITQDARGAAVTDAAAVSVGAVLTTRFSAGAVRSRVERVWIKREGCADA